MRSLVLVLAVVLIAGQGCRTVPMLTVTKAPLGAPPGTTPSMDEVSRVIWSAGRKVGWAFQEVRPGELTGTLNLRSHVAVVTIIHDTSTFSVHYKDSRNLLHQDQPIHRNYNNWVNNLAKTIQAEMAKAARDPEVKRRLGDVGAEVMGSTQEELGKVLRDQVAVVRPLVEELKLVVQ